MRILCTYQFIVMFCLFGCALNSIQLKHESINPLLPDLNEIIHFDNINPEDIDNATKIVLKKAHILLNEIISIEIGDRSFNNTLLKLDDLYNEVSKIWNLIGLLSSVHPSEEIRRTADRNDLILEDYMIGLSLDESLYEIILSYSKSKEANNLSISRKQFLNSELNDFQRNGMGLDDSERAVLKNLQLRLSELNIDFFNNIVSSNDTIYFDEKLSSGLSKDYKSKHLCPSGMYAVDLDSPSFDPFMMYADSDSLRKLIRFKYLNIGSPQNISILEKIIYASDSIATLLGYPSYAYYSLEESMAGNPMSVWKFENNLRQKINNKANKELEELLELKRIHLGREDVVINDWDKYYYENLLLLKKYNVDSEKVKEYFELDNVINGFKEITGRLFGIRFQEIINPSVWHGDVTMHEMHDSQTDSLLGRFYLDLHPRVNKYKHAAEYTMLSGKKIGNSYQLPVATLVCNFPRSSDFQPSLLSHDEVETLFHEFGHLIHDLLSKTELMSQSGTSVKMDFVEAPSQMLENWVWNRESLNIFAKHYKTGELIPDDLLDQMILARNCQSGNNTLQQIFYGLLDLTLYDGYDQNASISISDIVAELQNTITLYPYYEGTHQEASFDHLLDYSASYYGYLWSEVFAQDMYSIFKKEGILNSNVGNRYRKLVLEKGGSADPMKLLIDFLGREPNSEAFYSSIGLE